MYISRRRKIVLVIVLFLVLYNCLIVLFSPDKLYPRYELSEVRHRKTLENIDDISFAKKEHKENKNLIEEDSLKKCPSLFIAKKHSVDYGEISCKQHRPSLTSCQYAAKIYKYDFEAHSCSKKDSLTICSKDKDAVRCSYKACGRDFQGDIRFHLLDIEKGTVEVSEKIAKSDQEILKLYYYYSEVSVKNGFEFFFISCYGDIRKAQIVLVNGYKPGMSRQNFKFKRKDTPRKININLVMLDSVSRGHFYRSLKQTINAFNEINNQPSTQTEVLDFELFQALHGHSAENAHALFSGKMFPSNFTDEQREEAGVEFQNLYSFFQKRDFYTIYQDDMCYKGGWGLVLDLGNIYGWANMLSRTKDSYIDDTGLTFASCKLMEPLNVKHVFNLDENAKVCFNGYQMDTYYLLKIFKKLSAQYDGKIHQNIFSYTALNVAHDSGGIRLQSIDKDLSKFVKLVSDLPNTLTLIFADHGNTYTDFVYLDNEGKYEMFHPSLFMIVPKQVKEYLGDDIMKSLRVNQKKLLTALDLHYGLKYMIDRTIDKKGIAGSISNELSCSDLPLRMPNLCVCDGYESKLQNSTEYIGHLEFVVGQLNNIISKYTTYGKCKRLVPLSYENVLQIHKEDHIQTIFEIITENGFGSKNMEEKFSVTVQSKVSGSLKSYEMKLMSYDRISTFGNYKECSGDMKKLNLCVCDISEKKFLALTSHEAGKFFLESRTSGGYTLFNDIVREESRTLIENELYLNIRTYNEKEKNKDEERFTLIAVTFEAVYMFNSSASKKDYKVTLKFTDLSNMKPVVSNSCIDVVKPNSVQYLCTLVRKYIGWGGQYEYEVDVNKVF